MFLTVWIFAYLGLGLISGLMAGLLGVGGGAIMVPVLASIFAAQGVGQEQVLHIALGTSMATIIFTALASVRAHHSYGAVLWKAVFQITPGILAGTLLGTLVASYVSSFALAVFFSAFMAYVASQLIADVKPKPSRELPGRVGMSLVGMLIGAISALVAIGGGSLTVPFLTMCNVRVQTAIGTSAAVGIPIAIGGTLGYIWNGLHASGLPPGTLGYVHLPALAALLLASSATAPIGAKWAHRLNVKTLKRVFAGVLIVLCSKMLYGLLG